MSPISFPHLLNRENSTSIPHRDVVKVNMLKIVRHGGSVLMDKSHVYHR